MTPIRSGNTMNFKVALSIGLKLPDVVDASGTRGMALKVRKQLMACKAIHKSAEPDSLMVRIGLGSRKALLKQDPETYYLTDHYKPYPAILVRLSRINRTALRELLTESWEFVQGG